MATNHYTDLIESLKSIPRGNCEGDNRRGRNQAIQFVNNADLPIEDKQAIVNAIWRSVQP